MRSRESLKALSLFVIVTMAILTLAVACYSPASTAQQSAPEVPEMTPTPTGARSWSALLQRTPYPYTVPLPPPTPTILDGTYAKFEPREGTPVPCKRCPDYAPEGGLWKLNLDKGIFRVFYEFTGWRSVGSFTVSGDQLVLANDPNCPDVIGTYTWKLEEGKLILEAIEDTCSIGLRAINLTQLPWLSCRPPSIEAGVTDHWSKPLGCD